MVDELQYQRLLVANAADEGQSTTVVRELRTSRATRERIHQERGTLRGQVCGEDGIRALVNVWVIEQCN